MNFQRKLVPYHLYELNFEPVLFKCEQAQHWGGSWEQGSVRLHFHLDEQKEEKWVGEC